MLGNDRRNYNSKTHVLIFIHLLLICLFHCYFVLYNNISAVLDVRRNRLFRGRRKLRIAIKNNFQQIIDKLGDKKEK